MAAQIHAVLNLDVNLIVGEDGVFDVTCNSELIFSKHQSNNQFPDPDEIIAQLRNRM